MCTSVTGESGSGELSFATNASTSPGMCKEDQGYPGASSAFSKQSWILKKLKEIRGKGRVEEINAPSTTKCRVQG